MKEQKTIPSIQVKTFNPLEPIPNYAPYQYKLVATTQPSEKEAYRSIIIEKIAYTFQPMSQLPGNKIPLNSGIIYYQWKNGAFSCVTLTREQEILTWTLDHTQIPMNRFRIEDLVKRAKPLPLGITSVLLLPMVDLKRLPPQNSLTYSIPMIKPHYFLYVPKARLAVALSTLSEDHYLLTEENLFHFNSHLRKIVPLFREPDIIRLRTLMTWFKNPPQSQASMYHHIEIATITGFTPSTTYRVTGILALNIGEEPLSPASLKCLEPEIFGLLFKARLIAPFEMAAPFVSVCNNKIADFVFSYNAYVQGIHQKIKRYHAMSSLADIPAKTSMLNDIFEHKTLMDRCFGSQERLKFEPYYTRMSLFVHQTLETARQQLPLVQLLPHASTMMFLAHIVRNMAPHKIEAWLRILMFRTIYRVPLKTVEFDAEGLKQPSELYQVGDMRYEEFQNLIAHHKITFLGGVNSLNFVVSPKEIEASEHPEQCCTLKVENRVGNPCDAEDFLRSRSLKDVLLPIHAHRLVISNLYNRSYVYCTNVPVSPLELQNISYPTYIFRADNVTQFWYYNPADQTLESKAIHDATLFSEIEFELNIIRRATQAELYALEKATGFSDKHITERNIQVTEYLHGMPLHRFAAAEHARHLALPTPNYKSFFKEALAIFRQQTIHLLNIQKDNCVFLDMKNLNWFRENTGALRLPDGKSFRKTKEGNFIPTISDNLWGVCITTMEWNPYNYSSHRDFLAEDFHRIILAKNLYMYLSLCQEPYLKNKAGAADYDFSAPLFKTPMGVKLHHLISMMLTKIQPIALSEVALYLNALSHYLELSEKLHSSHPKRVSTQAIKNIETRFQNALRGEEIQAINQDLSGILQKNTQESKQPYRAPTLSARISASLFGFYYKDRSKEETTNKATAGVGVSPAGSQD